MISGAMSFDAQSKPDHVDSVNNCCGTLLNEGHTSLSANMQMSFSESGIVTSASLPVGSPVVLSFTIASQGFSIYVGRPQGLDSLGIIDKAFGSGTLQILDHTSLATLTPAYGMGTIQTYNINTTVGSRVDVKTEFDLNIGAFAGKDGSSPFSPYYPEVQGSINASHTTKLFVGGTGDISFLADSGHSYGLQLHPPALSPSTIAASTTTTIPGGSGTFAGFGGHASLSNSNSAYYGTGSSGQKGIYLQLSGAPIKLVDLNSPIPSGTGNFTAFGIGAIPGDPCVNGDNVAFFGSGSSGQQGIYRATSGGALSKVADLSTAIPAGTGNFIGFTVSGIPTDPCINGDTVAFFGAGSSGQQGIYRATSVGAAAKVADLSTAIPGGSGNFTGFTINGIPTDPCVSGDTVAFFGAGSSGQQGVYRATSLGTPTKVVDLNSAVPSSTGNFTAVNGLSLDPTDAANLAIVGTGGAVKGVYASIGGGALARIADTTMSIPGSTSTFADFQSVSIDPGDVAFLGLGSAGEKGIFVALGGTLVDVVDVEDTIGGKLIADLDFGAQGLSEAGGAPQLTYRATFSDGSSGIYSAAVALPRVPGDYNGNGVVDTADYTVWRDSLGRTGTGLAADGTSAGGVPDGVVDQLDYDFWKANFGNRFGSGASSNAAVPEPATLWLLLAGILTMCCCRRPWVS